MIIFPLVVGHLLNSNGLLLSVCSIVGRISPEQRSQSVTFFQRSSFIWKLVWILNQYHTITISMGPNWKYKAVRHRLKYATWTMNINETTSLHCPSKIRVQTMHIAWLLSRRLCFFRWSSSIRSRKLSLKNEFNSQHRFCRSKIKPWGSVCAETSAGLHVDSLLHRPEVRWVSIRDGQINIAKTLSFSSIRQWFKGCTWRTFYLHPCPVWHQRQISLLLSTCSCSSIRGLLHWCSQHLLLELKSGLVFVSVWINAQLLIMEQMLLSYLLLSFFLDSFQASQPRSTSSGWLLAMLPLLLPNTSPKWLF